MAPRKKKGGGGRGRGAKNKLGSTVASLLEIVGLPDLECLDECADFDKEWNVVKRWNRKKVLATHPDKGGDPKEFREVRSAFETLRDMFENKKVPSFRDSATRATSKEYKTNFEDSENYTTPSYDFYEAQEEIDEPIYKVELAKSNRSVCCKFGTKKNNYQDKKCPIVPGTQFKTRDVWRKTKDGGYMESIPSTVIEKGMIRIGSIDEQSGTYGRWCHLECWRVPTKIWLAMPEEHEVQDPKTFEKCLRSLNEILFTGMQELSREDIDLLVAHVMNRDNWAQTQKKKLASGAEMPSKKNKKAPVKKEKPAPSKKRKGAPVKEEEPAPSKKRKGAPVKKEEPPHSSSKEASSSGCYVLGSSPKKGSTGSELVPVEKKTKKGNGKAVVVKKKKFEMPRPGVGKARAGCLDGLTCVLTGVFPEVGGGAGLSLGKDRVKGMVESFGGRVTSAVSGKTDVLIVGKEPGMSKVSKGRSQKKCTLVNLEDFANGIREDTVGGMLENAHSKPVMIGEDEFSKGYKRRSGFNSLMYRSSAADIEFATGQGQGTVIEPKKKEESKSEYSKLKVSELRMLLKSKGLSTSGKKAELVKRLEEAAL